MSSVQDRLRVVLVAPRNPLNIGAAARAMSNFGFFHLRVVNAYDVAYAEARSAVNASQVLMQSQQYRTIREAIDDCETVIGTTSVGPRALAHSVRRLEAAAKPVAESEGPVAILFGSEKYGLSNEDLSHCHWLVRIPTREEHHSMNLGQSVAVVLYELVRREEAGAREPRAQRSASAGDMGRIEDLLLEMLRTSGYIEERTAESREQKIRRMLQRLSLTAADAEIWQGMLRQVLWKLRQTSG